MSNSYSTWQHPRLAAGPLAELPAWQALLATANNLPPLAKRLQPLAIAAGPLLVDLSREGLTAGLLDGFAAVAEATALAACRDAMLAGEPVNTTEGRAAHHTRLRAPLAADQPDPVVTPVLERMQELTSAVRDGRWRGVGGKAIRDILHIGIGGSALGPQLVWEALQATHQEGPRCHFVANVDGADLQQRLRGLDPRTTLCLVVSKSFRTAETLLNANSARSWLLERGVQPEQLGQHLLAVTDNTAAAEAFGIPAANQLPMWDWVGGRYSVWSAVGTSLAMGLGWPAFEDLLLGAAELDQHFATAPLAANAPMLLALKELYSLHAQGAESHAVLAYDHRLRSLPAFLQQLEMESNGKGVDLSGTPLALPAAAVTWGGEGSNGQHAFHQQLHQGGRRASIEFILPVRGDDAFPHQHRWLAAHCLAQGQALAAGAEHADPHRRVPGNRPSTSILMPGLTPRALGALLALYEHKTACQGMLWGLNAFDQFGVELGKTLADGTHAALVDGNSAQLDTATAALVDRLRSADPAADNGNHHD